jgi:MYXO-CTERM domain-containing protein
MLTKPLRRVAVTSIAALAALTTTVAVPRTASACGGCFVPPIANTIVSYHRMVLSISTKETTLYDQIRYSGNPASFAWVLPIRGTPKVGISADEVFAAIDQQTQSQFINPPANCPAPPVCPSEDRGSADASTLVPMAAADGGAAVNVLQQETVGPYETVTLESTNATALHDWLVDRGYNIPTEIQPLIETYVAEGFNFLALKLVPGTGTQSMRPVRITTNAASPSLPLRMVAAGTGATVGITLWVVGDGKWEPQSFPSFSVRADELTWDWTKYSHDYQKIHDTKLAGLGDAAWEIESSVDFSAATVPSLLERQRSSFGMGGPLPRLPDGGFTLPTIYDPILDDDGNVVKTEDQLQDEDMAALFQGKTSPRVTRLRSDLPRASLATDLTLQASVDQAVLSNVRKITKEVGEPTCPVYQGCRYVGSDTRTKAKEEAKSQCGTEDQFCASGASGTPGSGCSVLVEGNSGSGSTFGALGALGALMIAARRRRRR